MNLFACAAALGLCIVASQASATSLIFDQTLTPNSTANTTTFFDLNNDFNEVFDFSSVAYSSIDRFELTLTIANSADESGTFDFGGPIPVPEDWDVRIQGSNPLQSTDDLFAPLSDGTLTFIVNALSDTGGINAFAHSVQTGLFTVWLAEFSPDFIVTNPSITVSSAQLQVYGELAPVPLPAGMALLFSGLGGLILLRRRDRRVA